MKTGYEYSKCIPISKIPARTHMNTFSNEKDKEFPGMEELFLECNRMGMEDNDFDGLE